MSETRLVIDTTPERIFAVLADGWSYASWVVGAAHIRDVDAAWPAVGSRIHHRLGPWPVQIDDQTTVRAVEPDRLIELDAKMWPVGKAIVRLTLQPVSASSTVVTMSEEIVSGMPRLLPDAIQSVMLKPRNHEALRRLSDIAVHRDPV
ncbi:SRPBCC family protein [Asanoa sp. WMMD1127]|uniref:SRPBCC family protein n=1 Tax=Asanoa sp. WMMD1127 TaxID=3016107 RepID=UPI0024177F4C|nr:SRPBCC family protein [Asanoa sp. WMMD1127]MDG4825525.1 SRPBCC family protein [Asanoa sp. WMMD1127]